MQDGQFDELCGNGEYIDVARVNTSLRRAHNTPRPSMLPHVLLLSAVIMWGWTFVATKILLAELGPIEIVAMRLAIGLPFLGLLLLVQRVPLRFDRADAAPLLVGGAIVTVHLLLQIVGLVTTTATNSGWIISVTPLALAVLSFLFLRERIGWRGAAGIAVATAGILLVVSRGRLTDLRWLRSRSTNRHSSLFNILPIHQSANLPMQMFMPGDAARALRGSSASLPSAASRGRDRRAAGLRSGRPGNS